MRWTKRGLLFAVTEFAQSPQALVCDGFVRVYFSTRTRDAAGQYLSHVGFADIDCGMEHVLRTSTHPVMPLGAQGCFDEHGIFPFHVVRHAGEVYAYTCGWSRRVSVPVETAIGIAASRDGGATFERLGPGPVMGPSLGEPFLVGDPFVLVRGGCWHMWYIFGTSWVDAAEEPGPARIYKIAHATSTDGLVWHRDGVSIVPDVVGADECQALPTVFELDGEWHMYFCYRHATDFRTNPRRGYRIGYAWSHDLQTWTRDDERGGIGLSASGWDSEMMCYPHVFRIDDRIYMLYNGNAFGRGGFGVAVLDR